MLCLLFDKLQQGIFPNGITYVGRREMPSPEEKIQGGGAGFICSAAVGSGYEAGGKRDHVEVDTLVQVLHDQSFRRTAEVKQRRSMLIDGLPAGAAIRGFVEPVIIAGKAVLVVQKLKIIKFFQVGFDAGHRFAAVERAVQAAFFSGKKAK